VVGAWEGYGKHATFYGLRLQVWVSPIAVSAIFAAPHGGKSSAGYGLSKRVEAKVLGKSIKIGDKAYTSQEFLTPPLG